MDCEQVRKQAYRYRRGELIGAETNALEAHLDDCATCRDYYERLGILLESASSWEPSDDASDADDLFAGIAARIEADEADAGANDKYEDEHDDEISYDYDFGRPRWASGLIGLAAGVLLTLGGFYLFWQMQESEMPGGDTESVVAGNEDKAAQDTAAESEFEALTRQESASSQVRVFGSKGADWSLVGGEKENEEIVLELDRGTLLVEFIPKDGRKLRVEAPDMSVRVVGTVFYVSTDDDGPRVGVLAGEVEVSGPDGATATLESERELGAGFEVRDMPEARRASLARHVDPEAHLARLAALERPKSGRKKRVRSPDKPESSDAGVQKAAEPDDSAEEQVRRLPPDLERLRARAERATRDRRYHDAIRYYRSLLDRLPPVHPIAASVHLDLAHIYLHRLNSPGRAAPHLRTFVERWPSDVAADSARRELCKIDASEPGCEVEQ
jgi:hypothetical protein